jgi:hypothetical protein
VCVCVCVCVVCTHVGGLRGFACVRGSVHAWVPRVGGPVFCLGAKVLRIKIHPGPLLAVTIVLPDYATNFTLSLTGDFALVRIYL